jgi:hypothetical protein
MDCDLLGHDWQRDPERRGEGLVCARCQASEAEIENWREEDK